MNLWLFFSRSVLCVLRAKGWGADWDSFEYLIPQDARGLLGNAAGCWVTGTSAAGRI